MSNLELASRNCRKDSLGTNLVVAERNAYFFGKVYEAVCSNKDVVVSDRLHPTGILPLPYGRECVTEQNVFSGYGMYIQKLRAEFVDIIRKYPNQIQLEIWLPVARLYALKQYKEYHYALLALYYEAREEGDFGTAEEIAADIIDIYKKVRLLV